MVNVEMAHQWSNSPCHLGLAFIVHVVRNSSACLSKHCRGTKEERKTTKNDKPQYPRASVFPGGLLLPRCHTESFTGALPPPHATPPLL